MSNTLFWDELQCEKGRLYVATTTIGLCYLGGTNESFEDMQHWVSKYFPKYELVQNHDELQLYIHEVELYFDGKLPEFTVPVDLKGTAFQLAVWDALQKIQYGETVSYSQIAESIGKPSAVRAVGGAIGANPVMIIVPCHRVIGKNGKLTGFRGGMEMKRYLLSIET